jgi:hypothetical protein
MEGVIDFLLNKNDYDSLRDLLDFTDEDRVSKLFNQEENIQKKLL